MESFLIGIFKILEIIWKQASVSLTRPFALTRISSENSVLLKTLNGALLGALFISE